MNLLDTGRPNIFSAEGESALARLVAARALLAFDFDGTLAPIADHPDDVRVAPELAACLTALASRRPTAIVTGRAVADVQERLGFTPQHIVGNHGAESEFTGHGTWQLALDDLRARLARQADWLAQMGVRAEDKGQSIALHYRLAPNPLAARHAARDFLSMAAGPQLRVFGGKMVYNVVAASAPDKGDAVRALVARLGCETAMFVGDDVNDEAVFNGAPAHWLTVKAGRDGRRSHARFLLEGHHDLLPLLQRLLRLLGA